MSTEQSNPIAASSLVAIPSTAEDAHHISAFGNTVQEHILPVRWNWHDTLYLATLTLIVITMAYRYTPNLTTSVPGMWWDPLLNIWTMTWNTTILLHAPTHLWQASILYPNDLTLSYSENLLGETLFYAPFYLLTHNPVLSYNLTFYLTFLLCGINMYITARSYTGKSFASFIAALIYAFAPYRLSQIDHLHVLAGEWIPLAFLYLDRAMQQNRWRHWSLFALFYLLQLLSSIYYGIFLAYTLLAYTVVRYSGPFLAHLRQHRLTCLKHLAEYAIKPFVILAATGVLIILIMEPYFISLNDGLARSLKETVSYSASFMDFFFTAPFNWLHGIPSYNGMRLSFDGEHYLYVGVTITILAAAGILLALRLRNSTMRAYIWTGLIVFLFAFGPFLSYPASLQINIPMPWLFAYYYFPGFKGLRVPSRLIGVLLLILALLAAYTTAWLQDSTGRRKTLPSSLPIHSKLRTFTISCLLALIPFLLLLESVPAFLPITQVPTGNSIPLVYQWLATHGDQQPIIELPIAPSGKTFPLMNEAWYDYYAIYHPHPIVNGWSGNRPALTLHIARLMQDFPSQESLAILRHYHIHYVVLHLQLYDPDQAPVVLARIQASPDLQRIALFGSDSVWGVK